MRLTAAARRSAKGSWNGASGGIVSTAQWDAIQRAVSDESPISGSDMIGSAPEERVCYCTRVRMSRAWQHQTFWSEGVFTCIPPSSRRFVLQSRILSGRLVEQPRPRKTGAASASNTSSRALLDHSAAEFDELRSQFLYGLVDVDRAEIADDRN